MRGFLLVAVACSHSYTAARVTATADRLPIGPPLVTPGEHMTYRLELKGIELASYEISVAPELVDLDGKRAIVVQSHAKAVGLVKLVANVDDSFTSWIDVESGRPLRWSCDEFGTNSSNKERTEARIDQREGNVVPVDFHLNDDAPKSEPQKVSLVDVWDYNAFLVALRGWEAAAGTTVVAEVLRSRYLWHVQMTVRGRENLVTQLGALPALRFDGHTWKLDREDRKTPEDERDFSVWISDDDGRVPLQVVARTDYGDMKMMIVDYQPGAGQRIKR